MFSAALCRGLIEASLRLVARSSAYRRFPRLYAAASLKLESRQGSGRRDEPVFRGFMPRPH